MIIASYTIVAIIQDEYNRPVFKCMNSDTDDTIYIPCYVHPSKAKTWLGQAITVSAPT